MPFSSWAPRSSKARPEPATRSLTVLETSTSPGWEWEATRAPVCTAMPATLPSMLALACVQAGTHLETQLRHRLNDRAGASNPPRGTVEGGEEAVPGRVHLAAAEAYKLAAHELVVALEELAPGAVSQLGRPLARADDVGEEDGREDAVWLSFFPAAGL